MTISPARPPTNGPPPVLANAGELLGRYDVLFCDVWGVVHNGLTAFEGACAALARFRTNGGTVILVSNAPVPKARVEFMLARCHVPTSAYDDIVSSGRTMIEAAEGLVARGLAKPVCVAVHALFADDAYQRLSDLARSVVSTNTTPHPSNRISVAPLLVEALQNVG